MTAPVVIVGAGLSGLACARTLHARGLPVRIFERDRAVGGRVQTDQVDGFSLDRGFQVLLTSYPELRHHVDLGALDLRAFDPGAVLWTGKRFETIGDPMRDLGSVFGTLFARAATMRDKIEVLRLRRDLLRGENYVGFAQDDESTLSFLRSRNFSPRFVDQFFRPFLGGIFLEPELATTARFFRFVFRMFSTGHATVPAAGMGALPQQLAAGLPRGAVNLGAEVRRVDADAVHLEDGSCIDASAVVIATDVSTARRWLPDLPSTTGRDVSCMYFTADAAPTHRPVLHLNATGRGSINNLHVVSAVSPEAAPSDQHLISVTCLGLHHDADALASKIVNEARSWFGDDVTRWKPLRHYAIRDALPGQPVGTNVDPRGRSNRHARGVYLCGDYWANASIDGALASGRNAADAIIDDRTAAATG